MRSRLNYRLAAFSLIELSVVLVIVGVLMGAIFKGQDLLDIAKVRSVVHDFQHIKVAIHNYQDTYGALPGNDPNAEMRFGSGVAKGRGNGLIESTESTSVWVHLHKAGDWESTTPPTSKFGGNYDIVSSVDESMPGNWIRLSKDNGQALLTPKQVQKLMSKIDEGQAASDSSQGLLRAKEGQGLSAGQCVNGSNLNLEIKNSTCVVYMKL
ncbi:MAG: prepilin-type N-terminal cleavage/methylation domain-containing protein [Alphaproteobacteria bacterium]|jgi:prepilin-type N-terminal cleavage/methylation domain-containing protein|nr:prepilin-type N-terminal cleavage/methylation domain-containing protein [Alphaproteobacteria bacterium]